MPWLCCSRRAASNRAAARRWRHTWRPVEACLWPRVRTSTETSWPTCSAPARGCRSLPTREEPASIVREPLCRGRSLPLMCDIRSFGRLAPRWHRSAWSRFELQHGSAGRRARRWPGSHQVTPPLIDCTAGDGHAIVLASDLDNRWNDFPLRSSFVPLVHEMVRYLSTPGDRAAEYVVGDVPAGVPPVPGVVAAPSPRGANVRPRKVVVNVDSRESDPSRISPDEFQAVVTQLRTPCGASASWCGRTGEHAASLAVPARPDDCDTGRRRHRRRAVGLSVHGSPVRTHSPPARPCPCALPRADDVSRDCARGAGGVRGCRIVGGGRVARVAGDRDAVAACGGRWHRLAGGARGGRVGTDAASAHALGYRASRGSSRSGCRHSTIGWRRRSTSCNRIRDRPRPS